MAQDTTSNVVSSRVLVSIAGSLCASSTGGGGGNEDEYWRDGTNHEPNNLLQINNKNTKTVWIMRKMLAM